MKKVAPICCVVLVSIVLLGVLIQLAATDAAAQTNNLFPLKSGKTYHIGFLGAEGDFSVVTPPGTDGWAVVNIKKGANGQGVNLSTWNLHSLDGVGLNINQAIMIEERPSK